MAIRHLSKTHFDTADAVEMPAGTTAQRPGSPVAGMFRYNTDDNQFEGYTTEWGAIAGSGGGGSGTLEIEKNILTGNGSNTAFSTTSTIDSENNIQVYISGVYQSKDNFSTSGSTVTFTTAPPNGASVEIIHFKSVVGRVQVDTFTGDASDTTFDLSTAINSENNTQVFIDGAYQSKNSYSTSAATITFSAAPPDGSVIEVVHVIPDSEGGIEWDAAVKTSSFTALANYGYFVDTTSSVVTVTLPSSPGVGNIVSVIDCAGNAATNKITITSSDDIENQSEDRHINYNKGAVELVYSGSARGWLVASAANETASALAGIPDLEVDFLVVAGGGGGGIGYNPSTIGNGGGGGAGGLRTSYGSTSGGGASAENSLSLVVSTNYTVTVGAGGSGGDAPSSGSGTAPTKGENSVFSTITSTGGGQGHSYNFSPGTDVNGGSGGGGAYGSPAVGTGTAGQGFAGGDSYDSGYDFTGGGGGGASEAGANGTAAKGGDGGDGLAVSITGSSVTYAGGGGGSNGNNQNTSSDVGAGGAGGGGVGAGGNNPGGNGSANTGGGGGAGGNDGVGSSAVPNGDGGDGGSGVVILRYPQEYFIHSPSTLTSTTTIVGTDKVTTFTSGTGNITFETTQDPNRFDINYLVVAGGGSGGSNSAGGGGAGGLRTSYGSTSGGGVSAESSLSLIASTNYTVTVGAGAAAVSYQNDGLQGSNSTFSTVTSIGGGGGHRYDLNETSGGSGGGGNSTTGGSGTSEQGFNGGINSSDNVSYTTGGGGGGASAVGGNASNSSGGNGGAGLSVSITGSAATYAGGGGGAGDSRGPRPGGSGGSGGGGNGGYNGANGLSAGSSNTGGGGGGNGYSSGSSAAGGSGIVILRYPNTKTISIGAGLTGTTATDGTDKVTTFTAGTGTISFT